MHRHALDEQQWKRLEKVLPKRKRGPAPKNQRLFVEAVIYRARTGIAWRDLPERFGSWKSVYNKFSRWSALGAWDQIYKALCIRVDKTGSIVDGSVVRAHQDAAGEKGGPITTLWVVLEEDFRRKSTRLSTPKADRFMSR
jgi:transposase